MNEETMRIGNRSSGLAMIVFGGLISLSGNPLLIISGNAFIVEGIGDLVSGDHHYISSRVVKRLSKGKINYSYTGDRYLK